ncbi:MAG TPA: AAA family ATPase, partial [Planctomycetaceae bacterium]|nr:AAA family ATPase [Planctomycetaceae bacterium]
MQADLQQALDRIFQEQTEISYFCGVYREHSYEGHKLAEMLIQQKHSPIYSVPPEHKELEIGDGNSIRCVNSALWLLKESKVPFALLLAKGGQMRHDPVLRIQIGTPHSPEGTRISDQFFKTLEKAVIESTCYRGKLLSLEQENRYSGKSSGIKVHQLRDVERDQVILPQSTLDLLDRNVLQFIERRPQLAARGLSTQKGVLFYGPPGTGKTHTIHYLVKRLKGHTTFIISAEQVGMLAEYMTLARLLQPSVVVLEDVDLIARDRDTMNHGCDEVLLNKLLNEMDGLTQQTDVLFILTTNRPESLEAALASRPGRIDQAIEFPYPDEVGREKLIRLYACGSELSDEVIAETVRKTEQVSAAFIKELMRRAFQFQLERNGEDTIRIEDVDAALEELIFSGGSLNQV